MTVGRVTGILTLTLVLVDGDAVALEKEIALAAV